MLVYCLLTFVVPVLSRVYKLAPSLVLAVCEAPLFAGGTSY